MEHAKLNRSATLLRCRPYAAVPIAAERTCRGQQSLKHNVCAASASLTPPRTVYMQSLNTRAAPFADPAPVHPSLWRLYSMSDCVCKGASNPQCCLFRPVDYTQWNGWAAVKYLDLPICCLNARRSQQDGRRQTCSWQLFAKRLRAYRTALNWMVALHSSTFARGEYLGERTNLAWQHRFNVQWVDCSESWGICVACVGLIPVAHGCRQIAAASIAMQSEGDRHLGLLAVHAPE